MGIIVGSNETDNFSAANLLNNPNYSIGGGNIIQLLEGNDSNSFAQNDTILGGEGNDTISAGTGNNVLHGGPDEDWFIAGNVRDAFDISANGEQLILTDGQATNTIAGFENILFTPNISYSFDQLFSEVTGILPPNFEPPIAGFEQIGSEVPDAITGQDGNDTLSGGLGNDILLGNDGADLINGNADNDTIRGGVHNDTVRGGKDDDHINGNISRDLVFGDNGNDTLHGGKQNDTVFGGAGEDIIYGDKHNDTLNGGAGADIFVFGPDSGVDIIEDFLIGVDKIQIAASVMATTDQVLNAFESGTINLGLDNSVTLINIIALSASDIIIG